MDFAVVKGVAENGLTMEWIELKTLGKGSYGVVKLVKPINSILDDQLFAVKSCFFRDSGTLQKEIEILGQFAGCDRIVQCYGDMLSINDEGMPVYNLFLEYAPGGTLLGLIIKKYGGSIPECDVKCYARMLLEGIRDIHQRGYVHCDLKPANILVYPSHQHGSIDSLKIADFGLLRRPEDGATETCPGTPVYMPPESVIHGKISAALDIWSLGCIVLEMITGKQPWQYQNLKELAIKIAFSRYPPKIPETMSSTGKDFLMKCFIRDPSERWTADMLLSHPFLLPENPLLQSPTKSPHHAPDCSSPPSVKEVLEGGNVPSSFGYKLNSYYPKPLAWALAGTIKYWRKLGYFTNFFMCFKDTFCPRMHAIKEQELWYSSSLDIRCVDILIAS